jgi:hypothetical protein
MLYTSAVIGLFSFVSTRKAHVSIYRTVGGTASTLLERLVRDILAVVRLLRVKLYAKIKDTRIYLLMGSTEKSNERSTTSVSRLMCMKRRRHEGLTRKGMIGRQQLAQKIP